MKVPYRTVVDIDMARVRRGLRPKVSAEALRQAVRGEVSFLLDSMLVEGIDVALPTEDYMIEFLIREGHADRA